MSELKGANELIAKLNGISNKATIAQGLKKGALLVERSAKQLCPVRDGFLRASITHTVDNNNLSAQIGSPLAYAPYVEFGTGIYSETGPARNSPWSYQDSEGKWHTTLGQPPQPFLYPSLVSNKGDIIKLISEGLNKEIKK